MSTTHTVIHGANLKRYVDRVPVYSDLSERIDPKGINVVLMSILHGKEIRATLLMKVLGSADPFEATIEFPLHVYNNITQRVVTDDSKPN